MPKYYNTFDYVRERIVAIAIPYIAANTAANDILLAWQNPHKTSVILTKVLIDITTAGGTATAVGDLDVVANAAATGDTVFDGVDLNAAAVSDSRILATTGTNGNELPHIVDANGGTNDFVTLKALVEKCDDLVGTVYLFYIVQDV